MAGPFLALIIGHSTLPNLPNLKCPVSGVHSKEWHGEVSGKVCDDVVGEGIYLVFSK
jgi:hypothetical protein